ncbi:Fis family transcriptional regulator [Desulfovibrio subterraneus]|jgi:two-component system NtrC family response regulator|uniref:Fis family transcriptional regulator n=2 Tax=Desulfovibrio subterraneus TaxID=2718620 RepID=A0A7J0BIW8_9BACT|nr:Fis family transcriptional regulator [Desulfovibrio subterraneus]
MEKIHIIDDRKDFCVAFSSMIKRMGYPCETSNSISEGMQRLWENPSDIIFMDVNLPEGNSLEHIGELSLSPGTPDVVVITANGNSDNAESAIRAGAWDYLVKPITFAKLEETVTRCLTHRAARREYELKAEFERGDILGNSPRFEQVLQRLAIVSRSIGNVLLIGETGTGKELLAKAIHKNSDRRDNAFIVVDCTNLPTTLAESILLGHAKGAFTDAKEASDGLFKQADGGTIFLDEIGDLDLSIQKSLLRVLQERSFRPLKSLKEVQSDFRVVAATNKNLTEMVEKGEFRRDLYYRLRTNVLEVPPLRERREDIASLVRYFADYICDQLKMPKKKISKDFIAAMEAYDFPGNVRDVINIMHTAVSNSFDVGTLYVHHLPREVRAFLMKHSMAGGDGSCTRVEEVDVPLTVVFQGDEFPTIKDVRRQVVDQMEQDYLNRLIERFGFEVVMLCKISGMSRARLYELLNKHGISLKK